MLKCSSSSGTVAEAAKILKDVDARRAEFDEIIDDAMRPFVGPVTQTGVLTEDDLIEYVSQQQPVARSKVDVEVVLREFRTQSSSGTSVAKTTPVAMLETTTEVDDGSVIILRLNTRNGKVEPVSVQ